ncbi:MULTISPECIES: FAD binding domain-containing protein [Streptomyces]|uniref:Xanthine dehydrogenase YagS FAD-binding subunit n=1 Tax=Streptomyces malaysiensis TaxID=92644 RepID=A0A2J7ZA78_STRMQ|nr:MULTISPECIES: xanthine dehydrogenase family protein subunit M [Streptomyces]MCC4317787.1 xanthine dehydrogenase family protein subunit M [Streptomyces malaysiensis]MCD9588982.1 xanthine dehydrogenase family protein subunit M [Streptomyces sp. 8ZJF_21]MCQ6244464.1 xanthine dehydrogenase family protein subunit M [Streptomyces malaysiensis]PNG97109.1 xanthine dehydrogenase YagS FAD-binding subunit [Streptomyces malaysiensis]
MKEFSYERPERVREALALVDGDDGARFLGGGTNLVDLMKDGIESPARLVDVRRLPMAGIRESSDGGLVIGATTTNSDLAAHPEVRRRFPALSQAVLAGASGQLRNMATVGGNLLQRTRCPYFADLSQPCNKRSPGSGCPAIEGEHHNHAILGWSDHCVATHPSDMTVALAAFDAVVRYETLDGGHEIPLSAFYLPVGESPERETALPPGALITAVALPAAAENPRSRYRKVRERASYAFANASVAAALDIEGGLVRSARIALGGLAARPWRAHTAESALRDVPATADRFGDAADAELAAARPLRDNAYKVALARNLITAVLTELAHRAE